MRSGCPLLGKQSHASRNRYKLRPFSISFIKYDFTWTFLSFPLNVCGFKSEFQKAVKCTMFYRELQEASNTDSIVKINTKSKPTTIPKHFLRILIFVELILASRNAIRKVRVILVDLVETYGREYLNQLIVTYVS